MDWIMQNWADVIVPLLTALCGGFIGFHIGVNKKQKLSQKAGDGATQIQSGHDVNIGR